MPNKRAVRGVSDDQRAVPELDSVTLPFHRKARSTVESAHSAKFSVGRNSYTAVQASQNPFSPRIVERNERCTGGRTTTQILRNG